MPDWLNDDNLDYLIFAVCSLAFFGCLEVGLRRRGGSRRLSKVAWTILFVILIGGWKFVDSATSRERLHQRQVFESLAPTYADEMQRMGHASVELNVPASDVLYQSLIETERRWLQLNPLIRNVYTLRKREDGRIVFVVDSDNPAIRDTAETHDLAVGRPPGYIFPRSIPELSQVFAGEPIFISAPYGLGEGEVISAFQPLRSEDGKVEGVLGVDYPAGEWLTAIRRVRQDWLTMLGCLVLIVGISATALARRRADLDAKRSAEEALRESEARLRALITNLPFDFWVKDKDGGHIIQNEISRKNWGPTTGLEPGEFEATPGVIEHWKSNNFRAMRGEVVRGEVTYTSRKGEKRTFYNLVAPIRRDEEITALLGINLDITDRVQAERALRKSEEKLALHVEQTPLAIIEWDLDFRVTAWNPAAQKIFGYSPDEALRKHAFELIVPDSMQAQVSLMWEELIRSGETAGRGTNENRTKTGRTIICEWYNTPLIAEDGRVIGVASHCQDISDRLNLENQLRQSQKMESIGQLAGGVAHEFNNLLTPMMVQVELIGRLYPDDVRIAKILRPLDEAIRQAAELNQRILAVGRKSADQREMLSLNTLVDNAVNLLRHTLDRRIELHVELEPNLEALLLGRSQIAQIVMNLAVNARDTLLDKLPTAPAGWTPSISITTRRVEAAPVHPTKAEFAAPRACECLEVRDNGVGMDADTRHRMFEPFFTTKPTGKGTGLGLAVVWNVVDGLGGWIDVDSALGEGSCFRIFFPIPQEPPALFRDSPLRPVAQGNAPMISQHILLVEDNDLVAETLKVVLETFGHKVTCAGDGEAAWTLIDGAQTPFDLILTDLNMPRLSGRELLERLSAHSYSGRVVVISGRIEPGITEQLKNLGAEDVIPKPIGPQELLAVVGRTARSNVY